MSDGEEDYIDEEESNLFAIVKILLVIEAIL